MSTLTEDMEQIEEPMPGKPPEAAVSFVENILKKEEEGKGEKKVSLSVQEEEGEKKVSLPVQEEVKGKSLVEEELPPPLPDEDEKPPKDHVAWASLRKSEKEARKKLATILPKIKEYEEKLKEYEKLRAELEEARKQIKEMDEKIALVDITQSRFFREEYDRPIAERFQKLAKILVKTGKNQEEAVAIGKRLMDPSLTIDQIQSILGEDTPQAVQATIIQLATDIQDLAERRQKAIEERSQELRARAELEKKNPFVGDLTDEKIQTVASNLSENGSWLYRTVENNEEWNEGVRKRIDLAAKIIRSGDMETMTKLLLEGVVSSSYRKMFEAEREKTKKLEAALKKLKVLSPRIHGQEAIEESVGGESEGVISSTDPRAFVEDKLNEILNRDEV